MNPKQALLYAVIGSATLHGQETPRSIAVLDLTFLDGAERTQTTPELPKLHASYEYSSEFNDYLDSEHHSILSPSDIQAAIKAFIEPDSWNNSRNRITLKNESLQIVQKPAVLERIRSFVHGLASRADEKLRVAIALVPSAALETAAPGWSQADTGVHLDADVFFRAVAIAGDSGYAAVAVTPPSSPVRIRPQVSSRELAGYSISQTGVVPVPSPNIPTRKEGLDALIWAHRIPELDLYRVDLELSETVIVGARTKRQVMYGELEERDAAQRYLGTSVLARRGRTVVVCGFEPPGDRRGLWPGDWVALLRITEQPARVSPTLSTDPQRIDVGFLASPPPRFPRKKRREDSVGFTRWEEGDWRDETVDLRRLRTSLGTEEEGDSWILNGNSLFVARDSAAAGMADYALTNFARSHRDLFEIRLWQGQTTLEELGTEIVLGPEWLTKLTSEPGLRAHLTGRPGIRLRFVSLLQKPLISDLKLVSGGSRDSNVVQVADPVEGWTSCGIDVEFLVDRIPQTDRVEFRVAATIARPPLLERQARVRVGLGAEVSSNEPGAPTEGAAVRVSSGWQTIDLPEENHDDLEHQVTVPAGAPVLLNVLPSDAPGRVRALIAVVRELPWQEP